MTKKYFGLAAILLAVSFASCDDGRDYSKYDADEAESAYTPSKDVRMVKSLRTTANVKGREYLWEHVFEYDKHNRIKEINLLMKRHTKEGFDYYECNITSKANYYYFGKDLDIRYNIEWEYPEKPLANRSKSGSASAVLNSSGNIIKMSSLDFEYSGNVLRTAYSDGGRRYELLRDRYNDVTGYVAYDNYMDTVIVDRRDKYIYSTVMNNTNFDFSGYLGYWGFEVEIPYIDIPYDAVYQIAAFGMVGSTSQRLPGTWKLDEEGYPLEYAAPDGRTTVVTYLE